tara:strand:+ start:1722 stop:2252 length:531 start_codon:yes stop_codon:yes gene_type:complete
MIAIEKSGTIQTFNRLPNEWNDEKGYHINFRKVSNKEDYGFYDVITPEYDKVTQQLSPIFWDADNKVFTYTVNNIDFDATYPELDEEGEETGKTISVYDKDKLKADIIVTVKADANRLLAPTDWYSSRKSELGTAIPDNILADRKKIRDKVDAIEAEVAALTTVESILKYTYSFND